MKKLKQLSVILLLLAAGCSSSKITTSWNAKDVMPVQYKTILVLGLINQNDRRLQEQMEQHLAGSLTDMGYNAISALKEYGPKAFDKLSEKEVLEKLKDKGIDAVVTIVLLDKRKERKYVPGRSYNSGEFWNYFGSRNRMIYEPGYYVTDTKYFWESNFYEMQNQRLVYSAQTRSFSPETKESMGQQYGRLIVGDMTRKKILQKKPTEVEE
jgi:hypothetical protein